MTTIYKDPLTKLPVGFCCYKRHKGYLTVNILKRQECLRKQCPCLKKNLEHSYWEEREKIKELKKQKKLRKAISYGN